MQKRVVLKLGAYRVNKLLDSEGHTPLLSSAHTYSHASASYRITDIDICTGFRWLLKVSVASHARVLVVEARACWRERPESLLSKIALPFRKRLIPEFFHAKV
ncbi:hypothetical protein ACLOJK_016440 [Asimina triloba]